MVIKRNQKNRDIANCGQCKKHFNSDELMPDLKNNRYLCDSCYEPRDNDPEPEKPKDIDDGRDIDNGDDDEPEDIDKECRAKRGEARIERNARSERARPNEKDKVKSLIW